MIPSSKLRYLQSKLRKFTFNFIFNDINNMKKPIFFCLFLVAFLTTQNISAQKIETLESPEYKRERPVRVEALPSYNPLYIISVKKLPSYFISGEIPESFPKYDPSLKKGANKKIALEWCVVPSNRALLTENGKARVDAKLEELKAKSNK